MKIRVGVFFGGKSVEHEVSIISALQACNSINKDKYEVTPVYITKNNEMYVGEKIGNIASYRNLKSLLKESRRVILVNDGGKVQLVLYPGKKFGNNVYATIDVAFPIVHGTNVEDGVFQGYLQTIGVPYVGCDVISSAVGMDKYVMKTVFKDNGIPVLDGTVIHISDYAKDADAVKADIKAKIAYPLIVKPINLGSSVGIMIAHNDEQLDEALDNAFTYASKLLVEPAITNLKEINCSVCGDYATAHASECEEPVNTDETREQIRTLAVKAFRCLGASGTSRIDFMIDMDNGNVYLNEINTIPGSLAFYLWEPVGVKYSELLDEMISLALKRERENKALTFSFDTNILDGFTGGKLGGTKGGKL